MMRAMRSGCVLLLAVAACGCGGPVGPVAPQDRAAVHLVRCRPAPRLPGLDADGAVFGGLVGGEEGGEVEAFGPTGIARTFGVGGGGGGAGGGGSIGIGIGVGPGAGAPAKPATTVLLGTPSITGSLSPAAITRVLQHRLGELSACAAKEKQLLASGPASSRAVVSWRFTIGTAGKVIQADVTSHVLSPALATCVTGVVRGATFPAPPDGRLVAVTLPIVFDATGVEPEGAPEVEPVPPWTPFAIDSSETADSADKAARAAEGAMRGKLGAIEACFASSTATGSLRAMLALDTEGALSSVRAGGLGDKAIEACVENAVTGLRVVLPTSDAAEIACDLSRGDAQPWRVTADRSGYGVVEVTRTRVRHADQMLSAGEEPDTLAEHAMYVIVADADAPGAMLGLAMRWTRDADATLVAVRPASPKGAAARFLAMGQTAASESASGELDDLVRATLQVGSASVTACVNRWTHVAKLADPAAVGGAVQKLAAQCRRQCPSSLVIAVDRDAAAGALIEVAGAARRAGFERALIVRGSGGPPPAVAPEDGEAGLGCTPANAGDEP